jgi:hypothetical protein
LIQNGDWRGILSAAHRKHRGDGKSKWAPTSEPVSSRTGSFGFVDTGGEMVTTLITFDLAFDVTLLSMTHLSHFFPDPVFPTPFLLLRYF